MKLKHVGIYGGTFDPIHFGHLNVAIEMLETYPLDEVWFCPAQNNPHKPELQSTSSYHRLKMLEIALADFPQFSIITHELQRDGPSYTIDTLRELIADEKNKTDPFQFFLIIGEDSIPGFFQWRDPKEIIKLVPLLVARRSLIEKPLELHGDPEICKALNKGIIQTHVMDISATRVRNRIRQGLPIGHLVPAKVIDYIYQNQLY